MFIINDSNKSIYTFLDLTLNDDFYVPFRKNENDWLDNLWKNNSCHVRMQNEIILSSLRKSGKVAVMASEEDDAPVWITDGGPFVVVTDPLDGSRNIDASIPTGTIFGIYNRLAEVDHLPVEEKATINSLQSGTQLVASGYVLYSSATIMCISFGSGTHAFTLDHGTGDFILTHPSIKIPPRGTLLCPTLDIGFCICSLNIKW